VISLGVTTNQSGYHLSMASQLVTNLDVESNIVPRRPYSRVRFTLRQEESITLDKLTTLYTSRDVEQPISAAREKLREAVQTGFDQLLERHTAEWEKYWSTSDIQIEGDDALQTAVRFTTYHILIAAPR